VGTRFVEPSFTQWMFNRDQYRRMAEEATRLAKAATNEENRVIWLKIAEGYWLLAERNARPKDDESAPGDA
jgi:hypothetical protein